MSSVEGRVCVVTGAARGLGQAIAAALGAAGGRLALCDVLDAELAAMRLERIDERTLSAEVPTEVGVHALFDALAAIGVRVMALRNAANRLEQLFFDLLDNARERPGDPV